MDYKQILIDRRSYNKLYYYKSIRLTIYLIEDVFVN